MCEGKSSFPVVSTASTEKRYQVNVNMKPLFGGQQGTRDGKNEIYVHILNLLLFLATAEPFKLFGGDEEQVEEETQSKATFFDEEPKERNANFVPVGQRTVRKQHVGSTRKQKSQMTLFSAGSNRITVLVLLSHRRSKVNAEVMMSKGKRKHFV